MAARTDPPPEALLALDEWSWSSPRAHELARELCLAVAEAERYETRADEDPVRLLDATGQWQVACELAETLRREHPGPLPAVVEDALAAVDAAGDVRLVSSEPSSPQP